jgi:isopentenyl-diphosphate Delta-isomerase
MIEEVVLVDERDNELGSMEKMEAHHAGVLHRAFSVLLFNSKGEILLQKRSTAKYHSAGLWTNTCCSHPRPAEKMEVAVRRRLMEEMGIDIQPEFAYKFLYKVSLDNNLVEHELDHVYVGQFDGIPNANAAEVASWKFAPISSIKEDMQKNPEAYTHWFKLIVNHPELEASIPA